MSGTAPVTSAIYVDFDNVFTALRGRGGVCVDVFLRQAGCWLERLEAGADGGPMRHFLIRRCYMNIKGYDVAMRLGGFETILCPSMTRQGKSGADMEMALDVYEAAMGMDSGQARVDEFLLFSDDADFTPVLKRLRRKNKRTTILELGSISPAYRNMADRVIDNLPEILEQAARQSVSGAGETAAAIPPSPSRVVPDVTARRAVAVPADVPLPAIPVIERGAAAEEGSSEARAEGVDDPVRVLAGYVHDVTDTPLLSPEDYAALFRALAGDLNEHGMPVGLRFPEGRLRLQGGATPRDAHFVLRGLELAGYSFRPGDESPRQLAAAFLDSVLYRCRERAGFRPTLREQAIMKQWLVGGLDDASRDDASRDDADADCMAATAQREGERCVELVRRLVADREEGMTLFELGRAIQQEIPGLYRGELTQAKWGGHPTLTKMLLSFGIEPLAIAPIDAHLSIVYDPRTQRESAVRETVTERLRLVGAPLLSSRLYECLFRALDARVRHAADGLPDVASLTDGLEEELRDTGIARGDIEYTLQALDESGYRFHRGKGSRASLSRYYAAWVLKECRARFQELPNRDLVRIFHWITAHSLAPAAAA